MGTSLDVPKQLRQARLAAGEDLPALAKRTGVRQENLRAIEDGRFADLAPGIYGRNAVKLYANAFGLDGAAVLAACEPLLIPLDEPIAALARARGLRARPVDASPAGDQTTADSAGPGWRHFAAAAVDAAVIAVMLVVLVIAALTLLIAPVSALEDVGGAFAIMGLLLAAGYFLCFGGVRGATVGERAFTIDVRRLRGPAVTLQTVLEGALLAATEDARCIQRCGERLSARIARRNGPAPFPPPPRDPEPVRS